MRLRSAICCTLFAITLIAISVISFILQSASAQSPPDFDFPGTTSAPTVKSQLWINNGNWWGIFSDGSSGLYFYKKTGNTFTKGSLVDSNVLGRPDALWDGANLYVLVHENATEAKVYKYGYSVSLDQHELSPGFPVTIPLSGLPVSAVIAKDSNQKLWIAYAGGDSGSGGDSSIHVIWSTTSDHLTWNTAGLVLETGTATNATEVAGIVAFNDGMPKIGVLWSNKTLGEYAFKYHSDANLETVWSAKEIVDSNGLTGASGIAGDFLSIQAAPDGRILAVGNDKLGNGHVHLYVRSTSGIWSTRVPVNTAANSQPSRPILLLDTENNSVYCLYRDSAFNKSTYYARASLTNPTSFEPPRVFISAKANDPTSTKQHLNNATDLIAAASQDGKIFWNVLDLSAPPIASFLPNVTSGNAPLSVTFTDTSTDDGGIVSRSWNFGDGYTSTEQNPTHVFRAGSWNVSLQVTDAGGNTATSASQLILAADVGNPVIQAITPASVNSNTTTGNFDLTVDGAAFVNGAVVRFNGSNRTTTFVNATRLTATITLADVSVAGAFPITVALPDSAVSNALHLTVTDQTPEPTISSISPTTVAQGSPPFDLIVNGTNFVSTSKIWVNGTERVTTYVSPTQLITNITTDLDFGLFQIPVWVVNVPGGGTSNSLNFDITPVCPAPAPSINFQGNTASNSVHSQLWYNDGAWAGAISDSSTGVYFWRHTNGQFVKGALIDSNSLAGADTLWNGTDLFILTYQTPSLGTFYKYSYDSVSKTYTLLSGFPVNIPLTGRASSLSFTQDSTGKLWATYTGTDDSAGPGDGKLHIIWTTSADHLIWNDSGTVLESGLSVLLREISAITAFGGNKIGVSWSNQATNEVGFSYHTDGDLESTWSVKEVVSSGAGQASEYMSLKGLPDGRVFLAQEDNIGGRHVNLFRRNALGIWDPKIQVTRDPLAKPKSPIVLFDDTSGEVYVLYRDSGLGSFIYAAHMNGDSNIMPAGCPIGPSGVSNPTATKQTLNVNMDLAVAARGSNEVLAFLDLGAPVPPTIFAISPDFKNAGEPDFILTVDGANFNPASTVRINGNERATTFVSSTQLTAQITAADIATGGFYPITVAAPGEAPSNPVALSVDNLAPTLTSISPIALPAGSPAFELTAIGADFNSGTILRFNGVAYLVTLVSSTELRAQIAASEISNPGLFSVEVSNPPPGGGGSFPLSFTVENSVPTLTSISPTSATAGETAFTLIVNGANFYPNSVVQWNGVNHVTSFVSSTQLTAQITNLDIQTAGVFPVRVANPVGMFSSVVNFTVNNPLPQVTAITPSNPIVAGPSFTLTVNGSGFVAGSVVRLNGDLPASDRTTTFVSSTQLTATINAVDIATTGTFPVKVFNSLPNGGLSNAVDLIVGNPVPTINTLSPTNVTAGAANFTLTVNGSNFNGGSVVRINAIDRATTFVSNTQLTVQISASEVATAGIISVAVFNPAPVGGLTSSVQLPIINPLPAIVAISPTSHLAGTAAFTLTVNGTDFIPTSVVRFNDDNRVTAYVSATELQAQITAADIASAGTVNISVFNPQPGGGASSASAFTINNPIPSMGGLSPASATVGGGGFTLTVNGSGFINGSIVQINHTDRVTTFISSTQLTVQINASDVAAASTATVMVFTPSPGGGASSAANLPINNPVPTLISISPTSKTVGDAAFALLVDGSNFNSSSVVRFNGNDRPTTLVSSSQLSVQIGAADLSAGGLYPILVFTPAPGGGTSSAIDLSVSNPLPTIANLAPSSLLLGSPAFDLTINGTGFDGSSVVAWNGQNRPTTLISSTQLKARITAGDLNAGPTVNVTVNNPAPGGGTSNSAIFTVTPNPRVLKVVNASSSPGSNVNVTIQLVAQGDENALGFSLFYDASILSNPSATVGSDATTATLNINASKVAQGQYGVALSLPAGSSFTAGARNLLVLTFTVANIGSQTQTQINFGDQPVEREVSNVNAEVLATSFVPGTLTISPGTEGDVSPRPGGSNNGTVSVADWVQIGRFAAGIDTILPGLEFQKSDCSPRNTLGNGSITVSDWVQAGRFAAGLDARSPAGGPSAPTLAAPSSAKSSNIQGSESLNSFRRVRLTDAFQQGEDERIVSIELEAQGTENGLGFSLMFDPKKFSFSSAEVGSNAQAGALQVNRASTAKGRIGIAVALPVGRTFQAGTNQIVVLRFAPRHSAGEQLALSFIDLPISRELVAVDASHLKVSFDSLSGLAVNPISNPQYFVYQHYLDILGRSPDAQGLDYWTAQITACGSDQSCVQARRVDVSDAFFSEREFQHTGAYVHRVYKAAFGTNLTFDQFMTDRGGVLGNPEELDRSKTEFTNAFVERADFKLRYPLLMTARALVETLAANTGYSLTEAQLNELAAGLANGSETRGSVLRKVAENDVFADREYNRSFVLTQYYGYLRRDPEVEGFDFWLGQMNQFPLRDVNIHRAMLCSFISSPEYQQRFGPLTNDLQCSR